MSSQLRVTLVKSSTLSLQTAWTGFNLICILVGNPQQTPLWWKIATAHYLGSGGMADIVSVQAVCWERVELIFEHFGK